MTFGEEAVNILGVKSTPKKLDFELLDYFAAASTAS